MIKGSQKQLIVLRTGDSRYFDEAYFVLRREVEAERCDRGDLLREANRIVEESRIGSGRKRRVPVRFLSFAVGILCGAGVAVLVCLLL